MEKPIGLAASVTAAALLVSACSTDDKPYAHESMRHPTAAEQLFGTTGGELSAVPQSSPQSSVVTVTEPVVIASPAPQPVPQAIPQPVSRMAPSDATFAQQALSSSAVEVELARTAYIRAQSPEVRAFARQLLIDHRDMAIKLDNFALERGHLVVWRLPADCAPSPGDGA
jgi:uncharacterized protein (DUF305 family)